MLTEVPSKNPQNRSFSSHDFGGVFVASGMGHRIFGHFRRTSDGTSRRIRPSQTLVVKEFPQIMFLAVFAKFLPHFLRPRETFSSHSGMEHQHRKAVFVALPIGRNAIFRSKFVASGWDLR